MLPVAQLLEQVEVLAARVLVKQAVLLEPVALTQTSLHQQMEVAAVALELLLALALAGTVRREHIGLLTLVALLALAAAVAARVEPA
jgi:hypothetical protein